MPLYDLNGVPHHMGLPDVKRKFWQEDSECDMETDAFTTENDNPSKRQRLCPDPVVKSNICVSTHMSRTFHEAQQTGHNVYSWSENTTPLEFYTSPPVCEKRLQRPCTPQAQIVNRENESLQDKHCVMEADNSTWSSPQTLERCSRECLGGDRSPVSNRLRCPCRTYVSHDIPEIDCYVSEYY